MIVTACSAFGLKVFVTKTEIMCLRTKDGGKMPFTINTAGHVYKQTIECVYFGRGSQRKKITQCRYTASSEGLGVLPAVQEGNL